MGFERVNCCRKVSSRLRLTLSPVSGLTPLQRARGSSESTTPDIRRFVSAIRDICIKTYRPQHPAEIFHEIADIL